MQLKALLLGMFLLGLTLVLLGFTLPVYSNILGAYVYLDGGVVLRNEPFFLDKPPMFIVGRYDLTENTRVGSTAKFIWNDKEYVGVILKEEGNMLYINVSGYIFKVPASQVALSDISPPIKIYPRDVVGVATKDLIWRGDSILYYDKKQLDIGVVISNKGDTPYNGGPFYLISTRLSSNILPILKPVLAKSFNEEYILTSRLSYNLGNLKLEPRQTISRSLKSTPVSISRNNTVSLYLLSPSYGNARLNLLIKSPETIPPGMLYVIDKQGKVLKQLTVPEIPFNKTYTIPMFPNPFINYNYTTHITYKKNITVVDYKLKLKNYNNVSEPIYIFVSLPNRGDISVTGDLDKLDQALIKLINLPPNEEIILKGRITIRK